MIKIQLVYPNHLKIQEVEEERNLVKPTPNLNSSLNYCPLPKNRKNSMKRLITITLMRITEVTVEDIDPIEVNKMVEDHIGDHNIGEGDSKTITEANTKVTTDNLTPPVETIIIITMAITEAEVVVAEEVIISDPTVMDEAIIKAIIITNTIRTTHRILAHRLNNMDCHVHFVVAITILLNIALKENTTSIISWRK